jgi:hypothetical protein
VCVCACVVKEGARGLRCLCSVDGCFFGQGGGAYQSLTTDESKGQTYYLGGPEVVR